MSKIEVECSGCRKPFLKEKKWVTFLRKSDPNRPLYCNADCYRESVSIKTETRNCLWCKALFISKGGRDGRKTCSKGCSSNYSRSFVRTENIKQSIIEWHSTRDKKPKKSHTLLCKNCGSQFQCHNKSKKCCSEKCKTERRSVGGRNSIQKQGKVRTSKNERRFAELCRSHFNGVLTNEPMFNGWDADVILTEHKLAVLWNGRWHYEKITKKHSVNQVQSRDKIKVDEIKNKGYTPYVIKDLGKEDESFVNEEFEKLKEFIAESHSGRLRCPHKAE